MGHVKDRFRRVAAYLRRQRPVYELGEKRGLWRSQTSDSRMDIDVDSTDSESKQQDGADIDPVEDPKEILADILQRRPSTPRSRGAWEAHFANPRGDQVNKGHGGREVADADLQLVGNVKERQSSRQKAAKLKKAKRGKVTTSSSYKVTVDDAAHDQYMDTLQARVQQQWRPQGSFLVWPGRGTMD